MGRKIPPFCAGLFGLIPAWLAAGMVKADFMSAVVEIAQDAGKGEKAARCDASEALQPAHRADLLRLDRKRFIGSTQELWPGETTGETPVGHTGQKPVLRWRQPSDMRENAVSSFLTYMAREGKVPASTQNQAFSGHAVYWVRDSDPGI